MRVIAVLAALLAPSVALAAGFPVSGTYGTDAGCTLFKRFGASAIWTGGVEHDVKGFALLLQPDALSGELLKCPAANATFHADRATMNCIFGDEDQRFPSPLHGTLDHIKDRLLRFLACILGHAGHCAKRKPALVIFMTRDNVNRDMRRPGVVLEAIEKSPTAHVRQSDIQRDRAGLEFAGE